MRWNECGMDLESPWGACCLGSGSLVIRKCGRIIFTKKKKRITNAV